MASKELPADSPVDEAPDSYDHEYDHEGILIDEAYCQMRKNEYEELLDRGFRAYLRGKYDRQEQLQARLDELLKLDL